MNGDWLALGAVGVLAAAGVRRGSRSDADPTWRDGSAASRVQREKVRISVNMNHDGIYSEATDGDRRVGTMEYARRSLAAITPDEEEDGPYCNEAAEKLLSELGVPRRQWASVPIYVGVSAYLEEAYRGRGLGLAMYEAGIGAPSGLALFVRSECVGEFTNESATGVWDTLAGRWRSAGWMIANVPRTGDSGGVRQAVRSTQTGAPRAGEPPSRRDYYIHILKERGRFYADIYDKFNKLVKSSISHGSSEEAMSWALPIVDNEIRRRTRGSPNVVTDSGYHRTAVSTAGSSAPLKHVLANHASWVTGRVLDFGTGRGRDCKALGKRKNVTVSCYDPHHPQAAKRTLPTGTFDLVLANYVVNVLPPKQRRKAIKQMASKVKKGGVLVIAARGCGDRQGVQSARQWTPESDGHAQYAATGELSRFQRFYATGALQRELRAILGSTFSPLTVSSMSSSTALAAFRRS